MALWILGPIISSLDAFDFILAIDSYTEFKSASKASKSTGPADTVVSPAAVVVSALSSLNTPAVKHTREINTREFIADGYGNSKPLKYLKYRLGSQSNHKNTKPLLTEMKLLIDSHDLIDVLRKADKMDI